MYDILIGILMCSLETTQAKLAALYAKQGRAQQFTTQADRDRYLSDEIKALKAYEKTQQKRVDELKKDLNGAKKNMTEVLSRSQAAIQQEDDRRTKFKEMSQEVLDLRTKVDTLQEQRKWVVQIPFPCVADLRDLWREDAKLSSTVTNAREQLGSSERALQGMMDKVRSNGIGHCEWFASCEAVCTATQP